MNDVTKNVSTYRVNLSLDTFHPSSKLDLLKAKRDALAAALADVERTLDGLANTTCGLDCGGCGHHLATEADFAGHFLVRQSDQINDLLNLGWCPHADR